MLSEDDLSNVSMDEEEGDTPAKDINKKHRNITNLSYVTLGDVITSLLHSLKNNRIIKKTRAEMKQLLYEAYINDKLDANELAPGIMNEIQKIILKGSI